MPSSVTFSNESVTVDQGNGNRTYNGTAFNTTLVDQKPGSTTTPAFDINTGNLILRGGSVRTTETGTYVVNGAFLDYNVYSPSGTTVTTGTLQLTQAPNPSGGVRDFSLTSGTTDLIRLVNTAGAGYTLQVTFHATYQENGTGIPSRANDTNTYNARFDVVGTQTPAPTINPNTIQIAADNNTTGTSYFFPNNPSATPQYPNYTFTSSTNAGGVQGAFDINNGQLRLTNTTVATTEAGTNTVTSVVLYYRTRLASSGGGAYQPITLTQSGPTVGGTRTFVIDPNSTTNVNNQPNLIATPAVTAPGNYVVDVYYQANGVNSTTGMTFSVAYPPTGSYSAFFTVAGTPIATTIWTGAFNDDWFNSANWTNGVPDENKNALIRDLGAGVNVPYPNINSGVVVYVGSSTNVAYDNTNSGPAKVRNFTMGGTSQAQRSIARLVKGQLQVFGDFNNNYNSFVQRENTIIEFAGVSSQDNSMPALASNPVTQVITGGTFERVDISGGGKKQVTGVMNISESLNFLTPDLYAAGQPNVVRPNPVTALAANAGVLYTDVSVAPPLSLPAIVLADRGSSNANNGAQINGETDLSFLYGYVTTSRAQVGVNDPRTFGNIGLDITFTGVNAPGKVDVTRNTVEAYSPVVGKFGIRRIWGVRPADPNTNNGGLQATMVFHYRDSETRNLNGSTTTMPGVGTIPEANLIAFVSTNSGNTFGALGRDGAVDVTNNRLTKTGVTAFATFTLGDQNNPLPVRLTAFDAKRFGKNALVTWQTATELNSKGYEVQASTNGTEFHTVAYVASAAPNSTKLTNYSYEDKTSYSVNTVYYRLHQIDLDGKDAYFGPRTVNFDGKAAASTAVAYPNPYNANDELHIAVESNDAGKGTLRITDMTGRTVREESIELNKGLSDMPVNGVKELKAGVYMVRVTLPSGETKTLKVVKQ
ncbi:T9SS type A sorting domain-containing protein [Hymenobacter convexus]|uniref:T9SS type A sorting domain-containing protein n=1 Tax=Hymenobacter sp. CA1UV-4 TaxID=3063782 RepID=UPI002713B2B6|nr:T9SS type A sorting domain-containing protein [Hymenobacter sp. CA1UV-4]MDO7850004.1 T9SS type A sorting domain-containing protein [Hymenobacter sp. CA1UV-4]